MSDVCFHGRVSGTAHVRPEGVFLMRRDAVHLIRPEFLQRDVLWFVVLVHKAVDHQNVVRRGFGVDFSLD